MARDDQSTRGLVIAFGIIALAIVGGAILLYTSRPEAVEIAINPPAPTSTPAPSATPAPVLAYVTGAVNAPQTTVELAHGSRVQDAIDAAGGFVPGADLERVNLAGVVRDGDHIHVYTLGETLQAVIPTESGGGLIFVNTATLEELTTLPGIGPAIAQRIIDYREQNGPFPDLQSMENVNGIGPALLEDIAALVSFE